MVDISCVMFPNMVTNTAFILSACRKQNTLPPNSPILLGVKIETVIPKKTAFRANQKLTFSNLETKNCHLTASIDQFTNIKAITKNNSE